METATLTSKCQITVPKAVREALGVAPGDKIQFVPAWRGFRIIVIKGSIEDLYGIVKSPHKKPVTIEQMNRTISKMGSHREPRK